MRTATWVLLIVLAPSFAMAQDADSRAAVEDAIQKVMHDWNEAGTKG
jgi:hypothetical protein